MLPDFSDAAVLCVADATGALPGTVQGCWLAARRRGSLDALDPEALAAFQRVPAELVRRIVAAFRLVRTVLGERAPPVTDCPARRTSTARVRAFRARRRADPRQLSLLLPLDGAAAPAVSSVSSDVSRVSNQPKSTACASLPLIERSLEDSDSLSNAVLEGCEPKNTNRKDVSKRFALFARPPPEIMRAKRANLIVTLRRWARFAPELADDERPHRLALLDRAETALDDWEAGRTTADKAGFDALARAASRHPLDLFTVAQIRAAERGGPNPGAGDRAPVDPGLDRIMAKAGWFHGKAA